MAYTEPTAADLKARYPAFAAVDSAVVTYWLTDAHRFVDTSWLESDYAPALIAAAAHHMSRARVTGIASDEVGDLAASGLTSFKSGTFQASFAEGAANAAAGGGWASTEYGREYAALLRKNKGGPRVTVTCA